jgi:hypothetical protein
VWVENQHVWEWAQERAAADDAACQKALEESYGSAHLSPLSDLC